MANFTPLRDGTRLPLPNRGESDGFSVIARGVHTVKFGFRGFSLDAAPFARDCLVDPATGRVLYVNDKGWTRRVTMREGDLKAGFTRNPRGAELLWAEGPLAVLLGGADPSALTDPRRIVQGCSRAREVLSSLLDVPADSLREASVCRCDLAVDLRFVPRPDGLAILRALGTLDVPCCKRKATYARGQSILESVSWSQASGIVMRAYDRGSKGASDGDKSYAPPGEMVRIERQLHPPKRTQLSPTEFAQQDHGKLFATGLRGWHLPSVVAAGPEGASKAILEQVGRPVLPGGRELTFTIAQRLVGAALLLDFGGHDVFPNPRQASEAARDLRALGISLDEKPGATIPVGDVLGAAVRSWDKDGAAGSDQTHPSGSRVDAQLCGAARLAA